jgi:DNA-binding response OmpR family regulator
MGAVVVKPFDPDDLVATVRKALCEPEESEAGGDAEWHSGDVIASLIKNLGSDDMASC